MHPQLIGLYARLLKVEFPSTTTPRVAFQAHLVRVARALREIERSEGGEPDPAEELAAISDCVAFAMAEEVDAEGLADACRRVQDGYEDGMAPPDAEMLERLTRLSEFAGSIQLCVRRCQRSNAALKALLEVFDNAENRHEDRQPRAAAALRLAYLAQDLPWPVR